MKLSLAPSALSAYLQRQLENFFPDGGTCNDLTRFLPRALERLEHCFLHIGQRYYRQDGQTCFDHLNSDQYAAFLYLVANTIHRGQGDERLATKLYVLNKALHALDVFYAVELPDIFCFVHPVGTVIGRGRFQDYFCAYQNCTIGGDLDGNLPTIGRGVVLFGGSRVVGTATIGNNVLVSAGTSILGQDVPDDMTAFGRSPDIGFRPARRSVITDIFEDR
ncbi:LbetaH domain-containing protein [Magnetospirillum gryphiswaldense]|uniref:Serine O-acetyltransferase n=1 Tax=Magnetospirillum gryphiswaldense TaxID=55518 RepID=A4U3N5_9PROT|nr:serine acetyltransferase [Magnetospirillum gryphiswaldense]AVM74865.1 hypothetical protein MSR1_23820 [Magnetospirillum gryphiswaldense MSR-1]AVM78768.1 hypothetical protein MSR1L_23820 [Magnetospirillum gryphiswaldense]CAM77492.1 Serine O-acetyltransferase [Magnetospirillum gryphiswaldense MSR-1]